MCRPIAKLPTQVWPPDLFMGKCGGTLSVEVPMESQVIQDAKHTSNITDAKTGWFDASNAGQSLITPSRASSNEQAHSQRASLRGTCRLMRQ